VFPLLTASFALALVASCNPQTGQVPPSSSPSPVTQSDPKAELTNALKGADVSQFDFERKEDDTQIVSSFTNRNLKNVVRLEPNTNNIVLKYTSVKDKGRNTTQVSKTELTRSDKTLAIVVTDFNTGAAISKDTFPPPGPHAGPTFDSLEACIDDFNCKHRGELLCEANRTCKDQFAALTCCLKNGQCFSVHLIIRPTRPLCQLINVVVNFEGFVLEQAKTK
ncbi:MAG TPA: hypothetical protein VL866_14770, partial [Pyrinomonadaceae bacterium]|nr:hypothetical protein [Pyrinomonadaceae bacterium]